MKRLIVTLILAATLAGMTAVPATAVGSWVSLDGSPPGTPPTITLLPGASGFQQTAFRVLIHGYYVETVPFLGETFQRIELPEEGGLRLRGRPELPQLRLALAIPTVNDTFGVPTVDILQSQTVPGMKIYPAQAEQWELPEGESLPPAAPSWNQAFYQQQGLYPLAVAQKTPKIHDWRGVPVQHCRVHPFQTRASADELVINSEFVVIVPHPGTVKPPVQLSPRFEPAVLALLLNAGLLNGLGWLGTGTLDFNGCYLFLTIPDYLETLLPLVFHKARQGYTVTVWTTDWIGGGDCETLRTAVKTWHAASCDPYGDAYALLVGENHDLAMCYTGFGGICEDGECTEPHYSDFRYGILSEDLDDMYQSVGVGRVSVDSATDLAEQVEKIIRYENAPPMYAGFYGEVLLAAHPEVGRGYIEVAESVAAWPYYLYPLTFTERYGDRPDGTVANAVADIDNGKLIVAYRGHGGSTNWSSWDYFNQSLVRADVSGLTNGVLTPVVWSIACGNNAIDKVDDCIGERWMEGATGGAVLHYGSTRASYTSHNHHLYEWLFKLLFGDAHPSFWELSLYAQFNARSLAKCSETASNATIKQYHILGLPDLKIYKEAPYPFLVTGVPDTILVGSHILTAFVERLDGLPILSLMKGSAERERTVLYSHYSSTPNEVSFEFTVVDAGSVWVSIIDDFGAGIPWYKEIIVVDSTTDVPGGTRRISVSAAPNPFNPGTVISYDLPRRGHLDIRIFDARGRLVRTLADGEAEVGAGQVRWDGADDRGQPVGAGVYFYEVRGADERITGKLALVK
jgi:hypothetical protein